MGEWKENNKRKYKNRIEDFFDIFLMWFRDIMLLKADKSVNAEAVFLLIIFIFVFVNIIYIKIKILFLLRRNFHAHY